MTTNNQLLHTVFMDAALKQAQEALDLNEVPIGCVIVYQDNIIAQAYNQTLLQSDPCAHAEILALKQACAFFKNHRLPKGVKMYITLEPCIMCIGALVIGRIEELIIGARDSRDCSIHKTINLYESPYFNHKIKTVFGCQEQKCSDILKKFFQIKRNA